jgi:hypothetical protein
METTGKRPNLISRIAPSERRKAHRQSPEGNRYPRRADLPCKPEMGFTANFLKCDISAGNYSFRDQDRDRKEPELPHRQDDIFDCPLYELDGQQSLGHALLPLYTSWKFAVQEWRESPPSLKDPLFLDSRYAATFAHRTRCAAAIRLRPTADIRRFTRTLATFTHRDRTSGQLFCCITRTLRKMAVTDITDRLFTAFIRLAVSGARPVA